MFGFDDSVLRGGRYRVSLCAAQCLRVKHTVTAGQLPGILYNKDLNLPAVNDFNCGAIVVVMLKIYFVI